MLRWAQSGGASSRRLVPAEAHRRKHVLLRQQDGAEPGRAGGLWEWEAGPLLRAWGLRGSFQGFRGLSHFDFSSELPRVITR